jgi:Flp pilus assembly protein TadD
MPSFPSQSCSIEGNPSYRLDPEAERTLQLASQSKADGKIEEAIQHCREALDKDSNNPVALNNLAWILASASKPELRNGKEAVQLATRAVELTDYREPLFILTLAIAYAEAGDFSRAAGTANTANALAQLTRQNDIAEKSAKLLTLYASGKTGGSIQTP